MEGLKHLVLDNATLNKAVEQYLNNDIKSGVVVTAVIPYDSAYPTAQAVIPKEFQILFEGSVRPGSNAP